MSAEDVQVTAETANGADALQQTPHPTQPDAVVPPYRLLDTPQVILEELSHLYYEARHTRRMASGRASRLTFILSKASEVVNQRETQRELRQLREQLERLGAQPGLPYLNEEVLDRESLPKPVSDQDGTS